MSKSASAPSPLTTCSDARRLLPASVNTSVPLSNSNKASVMRAGGLPAPSCQRSLPAIIRCSTRNNVALERDDDALAQPAHADHHASFGIGQRWQCRAQYECVDDAHVVQAVVDDARLQALDVDGDVGQFGHRVKPIPWRRAQQPRQGTTADARAS